MGDSDRSYSSELRYSAADYDRARRSDFRAGSAGRGDRRLEIVKGNAFGSSHGYSGQDPPTPLRRSSPDPQFPPPAGRSRKWGSSGWCFSDPETKRRRRVASYKAYGVEGKLKASIRKGFRWIKIKCSKLAHGL